MSATLSQAVRTAIAPLIRLLSSPSEGEQLVAVGRIGSLLKGAGLTLHELASALERPQEPAAPRPQQSSEPRMAKSWLPAPAGAPRGVALSVAQRQALLVVLELLLRNAGPTLRRWKLEIAAAVFSHLEGGRPSIRARQLEVAERNILCGEGGR